MDKDLQPKKQPNKYFQDIIYVRNKLDFPVGREEIRDLFDVGNNTALALTKANNLLLIDHGDRTSTNLICVYNLRQILKQLGFISESHSLKIEYCFFLAPSTLALKIYNKIIFFSIWQHKERSFQLILPTFHSLFQLSNDLLIAPTYEHSSGTLKFLVIKWQTRQMKYLRYSSRADPVDIKLISNKESTSRHSQPSQQSDKRTTRRTVLAFLYQNGLIDLYDLYEEKVITMAMPKRIAKENFNKLFYLEKAGLLAEGSNERLVFWDLIENNSKLRIRCKMAYQGIVNHWLTAQVGEILFLVRENSAMSIHFDSSSLAFFQNRETIEDTFPYDAEGTECYEQRILSIHPLNSTSLVVQREIKVLPQYEDESAAEELPLELEDEGFHSLTKFTLSVDGDNVFSKRFQLEFTTDIEEIIESSNVCLNKQGDCAFWNYETGDVRIVLANSEWGLGWQDHIYREIKFHDFALEEQDFDKSVFFMSPQKLLFIIRNFPQGGLRYLLYQITPNKTVRKIVDSARKWPKASLIFPINEDEVIIQIESRNLHPLLRVNIYTGDVVEKVIEDCSVIHDNRCIAIDEERQIYALPSIYEIFVLYVQEKKMKLIKKFGSRINEMILLNGNPLLALTLESRAQSIMFLRWDTGEVITSYDVMLISDNHLHLYGSLGKELLFSSCMGFLQGLQMSNSNEKQVHFPLRKDDKEYGGLYSSPGRTQLSFYRDLKIEKFVMRPMSENSNTAYYHLLGLDCCMCGLSVCISRNCYQVGHIRRINKRFLVLKAMKERIGKVYNYYVLKHAFEFLFPSENK